MELGSELVAAVLTDYASAPISRGMKATLRLVEQLTHAPETLTALDVEGVRDAGVSQSAIRQAIYIGAMFNTMTRVSRALDFEALIGERQDRAAEALLRHGYRVPPPAPWRRFRSGKR